MSNSFKNDYPSHGDIKLRNGLNLKDVETGTLFEIDSPEEDSSKDSNAVSLSSDIDESFEEEDQVLDDVYDESLMNSLLGIPSACASNVSDNNNDNSLSDLEDDSEPFDKLARKMEDISGDDGVLKMEVQAGIGSEIPEGSQVIFHYSAYFEYADEPFDSSVLRKRPQKAYLNECDTLKGLKIGLRTMRKREKARFLVQPGYAYGEMGCLPRIPPNAVVLYEVTLLNWVDRSGADVYEALDDKQKHSASFEQKIKAARDYHKEGNEFYKSNQLTKAKASYRRASWILENALATNEEEQKKQCELLFRMHSNLAQVNLDLKEPARACSECRFAFEIPVKVSDELRAKLYFRYAKAKMYLADFDISEKYLLKAQRLRPNNPEIPNLLEEVLNRVMKYSEREKVLCRKMLGMTVKEPVPYTSCTIKEIPCEPLDPVLQEALQAQITRFKNDRGRKELPLAPNLTEAEVEFALKVAKSLQLNLEKHRVCSSVLWKVIRQ